MDQSRYCIQKEGTNCLNSHDLSSFGDSWEEQAFAEDAAGALGGGCCIWPPRSYTCSFCRREFRSAQALGGHMNVHRRDRARLKQINNSSPKNNIQVVVEPAASTSNLAADRCMLQNPTEICNPNFDLDHALFSSSSTTPNMVSILRPFTCSFGQEQLKSNNPPILSWPKFEPRKRFHIDDLDNHEKGYAAQVLEPNSISSKKDTLHREVCFTGNLNSRVRKRYETTVPIFKKNHDEHDGLIYKKRRIDDDNVQFFFFNNVNNNLVTGDENEPVVSLKCSPVSTLENLDLELRLGDRT
ncbi:uncharacterized protein [Rutidosis leptorrhynchoides]|uniref:uncharacterized protein n=1 Tax=Rutidosis leptorrhynchoides TaxID=125765 RepID=UPI003A99F61F